MHDITTLWKAFWNYQILPEELVEIYAQPYVKVETEGEHTYYGHGIWIREEEGRNRKQYITGCDAGVSFMSSVNCMNETQVTVISNTTHGAWLMLKDIETVLKGESIR